MQSVMIKADKARNLRYTINSFCKMEELLGRSVAALGNETGMQEIRIMFFCGLWWEDKELSIDHAGDIMDIVIEKESMDYLTEKIQQAMDMGLGKQEDEEKKRSFLQKLKR